MRIVIGAAHPQNALAAAQTGSQLRLDVRPKCFGVELRGVVWGAINLACGDARLQQGPPGAGAYRPGAQAVRQPKLRGLLLRGKKMFHRRRADKDCRMPLRQRLPTGLDLAGGHGRNRDQRQHMARCAGQMRLQRRLPGPGRPCGAGDDEWHRHAGLLGLCVCDGGALRNQALRHGVPQLFGLL